MLEKRQRRLRTGSFAAPVLIAMVTVTGGESMSANLKRDCTARVSFPFLFFSFLQYLTSKGVRIHAVDRASGRTAVKGHASVKEGVLKR
jgi:hypothetical protein